MPQYFTSETDENIKKYLRSTVEEERHKYFDEGIKPAFEKLIENLIYVYGFYNIDDVDTLKRDCLANLYEMLPKYNPDKGTKGFSYFNVVAKNWFIQKAREKNNRGRQAAELFYDFDHEVAKNDPSFSISPYEDQITEREFWLSLYQNMDKWRELLKKKTEKQVLDAVIFLMRNPHLVTIYNKKAVYLYLRDLTGLNTKQVVINLKKIKSLYVKFRDRFDSDGDNPGEQG